MFGGMSACLPKRRRKPEQTETASVELPLSIVILGATGDLARKKLYPALYQLMYGCPEAPLIPKSATITGYGRSPVDLAAFLEKQCANVKGEHKAEFLSKCLFFSGAYDQAESFQKLNEHLAASEGGGPANRLFFFSVPPSVFGDICKGVRAAACAPSGGWTRLLIEKPFGRDSRTFDELNAITSGSFAEDELFRIDHYLGKEVVLNLVALRFGNQIYEKLWDRNNIANVQIVFKEDLGTEGRGGYFDSSGIIRDIMQNHLLQVFLWAAMEPPASLNRASVQEEKVKLLKAIKPITMKDCFLGQFGPNTWSTCGMEHKEPGYLDDKGVPIDSKCPTYAAVVLKVDNDRWRDVPFLFRAGKGLDERMAEVRVTFKPQAFNQLVPGAPNELVMRIQPDEAIYLKIMNKMPGWKVGDVTPAVLDMSYSTSFPGGYVADGYERMFLNAFNGDGSLFVGGGELTEAWRIFTPLLDDIDKSKPQPVIYPFGVRVPDGMDQFASRYGIIMGESWMEHLALQANSLSSLKKVFDSLDKNGDGRLDSTEVKALARQFYDGREPTDKDVAKIIARLDKNGDGSLTFEEVKVGVEALSRCCSSKYNDGPSAKHY
mmetsp:Transcript_21552/g.41155  ORF Transcript_21552/g.41155 Transcript_21552/m.41155 type:complete len:603 (-) Transcript_21552:81-1889(-)